VEAPIAILYPGFWIDQGPNSLLGTTANLSEGGVCFTVNGKIPQSKIVLHIDYEGMGAEYVLGTIVKETLEPDGIWRYHCQIERILTGVDPMSVFE
jgi:hypothetical protein